MFDLHVVGGGPSGLISSISAVRNRDARVALSEEHAEFGKPQNCSGLLSKSGLSTLSEFFSYKKFIRNRIRGAEFHLGGDSFTVERKEDVAYVCDRAAIDADLACTAEKDGVHLFRHERICSLEQLKARNIIGADGPVSSIAEQFRFPKIRKYILAGQAYADYRSERPDFVQLFISSDFPGFFGWVVPQDEYSAEIGCGVQLPNQAHAALNGLLKKLRITSSGKPSYALIPVRLRAKTALKAGGRNVLLVGDAAGQVKSTTGGGLIFGGNCARIAGGLFDSPSRYESAWRKNHLPDLFLHSLIHHSYSSLSDARLASLSKLIKKHGMDKYISEFGDMDKPTKLIDPRSIARMLKRS
ncbi:MAG: hypothetical protein ACP5NX_01960 [Candidatus Bilamarchaeaceae archaeon]